MPPKTTPNKRVSKLDAILTKVGINAKVGQSNLVSNLLKPPRKDTRENMPETQVPTRNAVHQIDLIFLPNDNGYRYALVAVDLATSHFDAEPLKTKVPLEVRKALQAIYKRKYLSLPTILEVDSGSEFKGEFAQFFAPKLEIRTKKPGRHRSQAVVEAKNSYLSTVLGQIMLNQELLTGVVSTDWVLHLRGVVDAVNSETAHAPREFNEPPRCSGKSCELLDEGTKVRIPLENPVQFADGKKLSGKFRRGDVRWETEPRTITQVLLRPNQPPMYVVSGLPKVGYTRNQLQLVAEDEALPTATAQTKFVVESLLDRRREKGRVELLVKWKGYTEPTWEPRANIVKDAKAMVLAFEHGRKGQK